MVVARIKGRNEKNYVVSNKMKGMKVTIQNPQESDVKLRTLSELSTAQSEDKLCKQSRHMARQTVCLLLTRLEFFYDKPLLMGQYKNLCPHH